MTQDLLKDALPTELPRCGDVITLTGIKQDALLEDVDDLDRRHLGEVLRQELGLDSAPDVGRASVVVIVVVFY